ncbi:hypothetical protein SDC9_191973 [bioreactor metagenome]|uniref:Uncharacterized protein n=1 Tax=bioreactor metagenome TaxID=1076179 RepID=A0A645HZH7_9ZZZZ
MPIATPAKPIANIAKVNGTAIIFIKTLTMEKYWKLWINIGLIPIWTATDKETDLMIDGGTGILFIFLYIGSYKKTIE